MNLELPIKSSRILLVVKWCFNTPKAGPLSCVTSPIQKEKVKIVILSILNVLGFINVIIFVISPCGPYSTFIGAEFATS